MKKGTYLITKSGKATLKIIGTWDGDLILENINEPDDDVMVYSRTELQSLIDEGTFIRLNSIGEPIK